MEKKIVKKPWGQEEIFAITKDYVGKVLFIKAGEQLSLQYHEKKEESIYVSSGSMEFSLENENGEIEKKTLQEGMHAHISPKRKHRMKGLSDCLIFEVSTPHLEDVVRLEDSYGRNSSS